ncbi:MAG: glycerol-3-phosphate cytidylyltransferase [Lachnospiraceae bacterium]|nr:glycerol-3-phosphate cytidylyltransferase [Lachnospiraceae bacterium]
MEKKSIGYTAGTFDMFHIGHLNLIKNAKSRCDYLIVGVNSDRLVEEYKGKKVVVPIEERMEIIRALRFVDDVVCVDSLDKKEIWKQLHYDFLFIGDDWKGNPRWEATAVEMKEYGVETVFLPHTEGTNSTLLREKLVEY